MNHIMICFWFTADNPMLPDDWQNPDIIVIQVHMTSTLKILDIVMSEKLKTSLLEEVGLHLKCESWGYKLKIFLNNFFTLSYQNATISINFYSNK